MFWLIQFSWVIFCLWLLGGALTLVALARHKALKPVGDARLRDGGAPTVSVLIPARNEERRVLKRCVRSILAQDYGDFEAVAVNDRSTDATGAILRSLAAEDDRLRVVEGEETPAGWLGKPFALQQALEASRGSWVLSTDADMIFAPTALRTAVAYAVENGCDALTLVPHFDALSFWERVFVPTWFWGALILFPQKFANSPKTSMAIGVGGFYLIRRAAPAPSGAFGPVPAGGLNDIPLAGILTAPAPPTVPDSAPALLSTRMYTNLSELWESSAKNWFAILRFSLSLTFATLAWMFFVAVVPPALAAASALALALGHADEFWRQLLVPALASWALFVSLHMLVNRR